MRLQVNLIQLLFQSTPSVGRATMPFSRDSFFLVISIHALRGEGDSWYAKGGLGCLYFNPRPPWGGRLCYLVSPRTL